MPAQSRDEFRALLAYLGSKRKFCPLIFSLIAGIVAPTTWPGLVFVDPFSGGGSVALYAKMQGFHVVAADLAERACIVARALIGNSTVHLTIEDVLDVYREPVRGYPQRALAYVPSTFSTAQAHWLDRALARATLRHEPVRSLLLLVIVKAVLRWQPGSVLTATDARAALTGNFDAVSPRRLAHFVKASAQLAPERVWKLAEDVNAGVAGGKGEARKAGALITLASSRADIAYIDPPYAGTTSYASEYRVLDEILGDDHLDARPPGLDDLLDAARDIQTVVLSYGGPSTNLDQLTALVSKHRTVQRALAIPYQHLASLATEEKNAGNKEFLVVATA